MSVILRFTITSGRNRLKRSFFNFIKKPHMKTVLSFCICLITIPVFAQKSTSTMLSLAPAGQIRLNAYGAYVFDDRVDVPENNFFGIVRGGFQWGFGAEYMVRPDQSVELMYIRQNTVAETRSTLVNGKAINYNLGVNYIMLGGNRYFSKPGGRVEGFLGAMVGANFTGVENPTNNNRNTITKFAIGMRGGANVWVTGNIGIKVQAQLLSAVQGFGGGVYVGTGGIGFGTSTYSSIYQFGLGGGLVYRLQSSK
jgi:hypothetical protein